MTKDQPITAFVYGTLMFEPIIEALLGRIPENKPFRLHGYRRFRVPEQTYPAILPDPTAFVDGILYFAITFEEKKILDAYERDAYQTEYIDDGKEGRIYFYVFKQHFSNLSALQKWDKSIFDAEKQKEFVKIIQDIKNQLQL